MMEPRPSTVRVSAAFGALVLSAGGNAVAIKFLLRDLAPFWGATVRFGLSTLVFVAVALAVRAPVPTGSDLRGAVVYGLLFFGIGFGAAFQALRSVDAGVAQTLLATVPLSTFLLAVLQRQERFTRTGLVATLVAVVGVAVIVGGIGPVPPGALVLLALTSVCWAQAGIVAKRHPGVHASQLNAVGMAAGTVFLLLAHLAAGEPRAAATDVTVTTVVAMAYVVLVGSVATFWLFQFVLRAWSASAASYQMVLLPVVATLAGAVLLDEQLTPALLGGGVLVLVGSALGLRDRATAGVAPGDRVGEPGAR